jgi:CDP-glycerol glycerophosphotransferase (TagB/SpsB family)
MVTDYSGVQFDFAYQRKPIVYYHPNKLPPHYKTGVFDYEKAGFGPVCKEENEIVEELCNYMKNNCKTEKKYIERANKFFYFNDYNNRERIYKACKEYQDSSK